VLPLSAERKPLVPFAEASRNWLDIERLWSRFPSAGVGVGAWEGLLVVDVEHPDKGGADGFATMRRLVAEVGPLKRTRAHRTKSGGMHYVFAVPVEAGLRSSQGRLHGGIEAPGVDIVTGRAVLRWPPTAGYVIVDARQPAPLPAPWLRALTEPPRPAPKPVELTGAKEERYALAVLEREAADHAALGAGRNVALTSAAARVGSLVHLLGEDRATAALLAACEANGSLKEHGRKACEQTIRRGLRYGARTPRVLR
jgi:hypothetical protein